MHSSPSSRAPSGDAATDAELIELARRSPGSRPARRAASELLGRYQEAVYLWCRRYMHDHEQALDLAQDVLLSAYRGLNGFQGRSGFASWLLVIARNRCITELRRPGLLIDEDFDLDEVDSPARAPDRELEEKIDEEALLELMRRHLEREEQEALWLRCIDRVPVDEITEILGVTDKSGARGLLQRARRKLRAALDGQGQAAQGETP